MHHNLETFVRRWDELASTSGSKGYAKLDALNWFNYLGRVSFTKPQLVLALTISAFDVIGDLAFGAPFGMLEKGADIAEIRSGPDAKPTYAPAIEVLNRRGEVSA